MNALWFMMGVLTTIVTELVACIAYAVVENNKGGKRR